MNAPVMEALEKARRGYIMSTNKEPQAFIMSYHTFDKLMQELSPIEHAWGSMEQMKGFRYSPVTYKGIMILRIGEFMDGYIGVVPHIDLKEIEEVVKDAD